MSSLSSLVVKPYAADPFHGGTDPNRNQNPDHSQNPEQMPYRSQNPSQNTSHGRPIEFLPLRPTSVRAVPSPDGCTYPWEACRAKSEWVSGIDVNQIPQDCHESSSPHSVLSSGPSSAFFKRDRERETEREGEREKTSESSDQEQRGGWEISSQGGGRGGSDEDEGGGGGSSRKKLRLSKEQSALLEKSFRDQSTLNTKQKNALAVHLNLTPRQVEVWFQNRRARTKLKQTEVDCEFLKRRCESLTEQNQRLQREVQELRAIKVAPPCIIAHDYYMPMPVPVPAATLTVCPSCQRLATMDNNRTLGLPRQQPPPSAAC